MPMKNRLKNVHIHICGVNLNRLYRECQKQNICLSNINRIDYKNIQFDVSVASKKKLLNLAKNQNWQVKISKNYGFEFVKSILKFRFGIILGIIVFLVLNFVSGLFVWNIKIYGNSKVSSEQIINVLKNQNISVGKVVGLKQLQSIETTLSNSIADISLCSVIKKGTTIIVNIKEKLPSADIQSIGSAKDIIAPQNLTIISLSVSNGTALKKVGDSVKQGDVIVAGYVLDEAGNKIVCKANATILAKTWHSATKKYQKVKTITQRTGKKTTSSFLSIFGWKFNVKMPKTSYNLFEEEEKVTTLKNNFLPFKLHTKTTYQLCTKQVKQNFEADKDEVLKSCRAKAFKQVKEGQTVCKMFDVIDETLDSFVVTSYVEVTFNL